MQETTASGGKVMFTYYQLKVFCAAIENGSFVKAAQDLFTSQPAISHHIKALEQHFGVPLLLRNSRGINLTEAGTGVYESAKTILNEINKVEEKVREHKNSSSAYTIGAGLTSGIYILPKIIARYEALYPDIGVKLIVDSADNLLEGLRKNKIDLIFKIIPKCSEHFNVFPVFNDKLMLISSSKMGEYYQSLNKRREKLSSLKIIYLPKAPPQTREYLGEKLKDVCDELNITTEMKHPDSAKKAVESGLGVALMFQCSVLIELQAGYLKELPIDLGLDATFGFMWKQGKKLARPLNRFMEVAREQIS